MPVPQRPLLVFALTAGFVIGCSANKVDVPDLDGSSSSHGVIVTTPTVVVVGSPKPSPSPGTPSPSPTPSPTPSPNSAGCNLPPGGGSGNNCERTSPSFLETVDAVIDQIVRDEPQIFDLTDAKCGNCYKVRDTQRFVSRVLELLHGRGLCAIHDGEELAVKNTNEFNDQYDILTAENYLRRGDGSYRSTCRPAWF